MIIIFPFELIVSKQFFISPLALQMHIKSIIIRESKLDVLRQLQECIIISLPKALQLDYSVYLCTLKACFQTHCLQSCPSKTAVFVRVIESQLATYHRTAGCRQLTYSGSFSELTEVEVGLTSIILFCTFEKYLHHAFSRGAIFHCIIIIISPYL